MNSKTIPKIYKKDILAFCKEYEQLAITRKIKVTIPKQTININIRWVSDNKVDITDEGEHIVDSLYDLNIKELKRINCDIELFIQKTRKWGKKHFKDDLWLWENVFWLYHPEFGYKVKELNISWE
jgi:hypothetical protein